MKLGLLKTKLLQAMHRSCCAGRLQAVCICSYRDCYTFTSYLLLALVGMTLYATVSRVCIRRDTTALLKSTTLH